LRSGKSKQRAKSKVVDFSRRSLQQAQGLEACGAGLAQGLRQMAQFHWPALEESRRWNGKQSATAGQKLFLKLKAPVFVRDAEGASENGLLQP